MRVQSTYKFSSSTFKMLYFLRSIFLAKIIKRRGPLKRSYHFHPRCYAETPVSKILFEMFFGLYLIFIIWLLYLIVKVTSKFLKKTFNIWAILKSWLLRAFLLGILFSYQNLVMGAFTLVRCVDFANIKVLHIEGDVQCYNWWQYLVMCYIIFFIIPVFPCIVSFSTSHKRQIHVSEDLHFELLISSSSYDVLCDQRT